MGALRLLLAFLVLLSHMGYSGFGYNLGVMAVVVFYLLAGQVVAKLWLNAPTEQRLHWFMRDRALRILPQYYTSLLVAALLWWGLHPDNYHVSIAPNWTNWLENLTILPLNYYMFNGSDRFTLLAPAWSLAVEIQFYLLVPLLLLNRNILYAALGLSLVVFTLAQLGYLNSDIYGYRLLPGVLFVFLSGALCIYPHAWARHVLLVLWLLCCIYITYLLRQPYTPSFVLEVAVGFMVGLPLVWWHSQPRSCPRSTSRWARLQQRAGLYSYALFLIHFPLLWWLQPWLGRGAWAVTLIVVLSLLYAELVYRLIERPLWRRYRPFVRRAI